MAYEDLFDPADDKKAKAGLNLRYGIEAAPDVAARDASLAKRYGLPAGVIEQYRPDYDARAKVEDAGQLLDQSPKLRDWLAADPIRAKVSHDDIGNLSAIESAVRYLVSAPGAPRGGLVADVGRAGSAIVSGAPSAGGALYGAAASVAGVADQYVQTLDDLAALLTGTKKRQIVGTPGPESWLLNQQKQAQGVAQGMLPDMQGMSPEGRGLWSGLQSGGQNLITLPFGLAAKTPNLMLGIMGAITGGQSYGKGRDAGLDPAQAAAFGIQDAMAEIVTERFLGAAGFLKNIKAGASAGKLFGYEVFKEVPGEIGATLWQNFNEWANVNPDKSVADFLAEQPDAIVQTVIATIVGGSVQIGAVKGAEKVMGRFSRESQGAAQAQMSAQQLDTIASLIEAGKLRQRDPEAFATFAQSLTEEGVSSLYVDARALQQSGVDLQALAQALPSVAQQIEQAAATGGDVVIPTGEFLTQAPGQEWSAALIDHARTAADAMSPAGAREYMQAHGEQLQDEIAKTIEQHATDQEWQAGRDAVRSSFEAQLNEVGRFTPDVNRQYAALLGDYYAATAARAGMTPQELAERYPLRIQATAPGGAVNAMEQGDTLPKLRASAVTAAGTFDAMDARAAAGEQVDADEYMRLADELSSAQDALSAGIAAIPDDAFGLQSATRDGRMLVLNASAQQPGKWQLTRFDKAGVPFMDTQHDTKLSAVKEFVNESDPASIKSFDQALNQSARLPATIDIDGQQRPTTNSKGQQIAATEEGVRNFWKWFGASRVVDANGRPLVVYHSTLDDKERFNKAGEFMGYTGVSGISVTDSPEMASRYLERYGNFRWDGKAFEKNVMALYVRAENPLYRDEPFPTNLRLGAPLPANYVPEPVKMGHDALVRNDAISLKGPVKHSDAKNAIRGREIVVFSPEQIKSATGNIGTFDPANPSILNQSARAQIAFGPDITQTPSVISLFNGADLSSFIHEAGHFFLEAHMDLAGRIAGRIADGEQVSDGERGIVADANALLGWFGLQDTPELSALDQWHTMTLDEKRPYHEQFARGFEVYAIEGKAPSLSLQSVFQRFSSWLKNVYRSITQRAAEDVLQVSLTDEVRQVMDRMIATDEQIAEAQAMREMGPLFGGADQAGMTPEQWAKYHELAAQATANASEQLQARGLRDMQWLRNARSRELKRLQDRAAGLRREVEMEVRRDVLSRPIYRAWQFLTTKGDAQATAQPTPRVRASGALDPASDNLFTAIAKLGGLDRSEVVGAWGVDPKDRLESGVFGAPVLRKENGLSIDAMAEKLAEEGYLLRDENGRTDPADLEAAFDSQRRGVDQYSTWHDLTEDARVRAATGADAPEALPDEIMHGKLDTAVLRDMYGTKPDALWRTLSTRRMTSEASGIHPEVVAETFGYDSADALVRALAAADPPRQVIEGLTDQRMLERYGDLATPEGLQRAADEAIHNEARARAIATELDALEKMGKVRAGEPRTADVLAKAARDYALAVIGAKKVRDIRPGEYTAAEARASKAAQKAFKAGDTQAAATEKRHQLIQHAAAKAALQAREEIDKTLDYLRRMAKRPKSIAPDYADQIDQLLERFDLRPASLKELDKRAGLQAWVTAQQEQGKEVDIPPELLNEAARTSWRNLTLDELRGLRDTVKQIEHLGRTKGKLLASKAKREFEAVRDELADGIELHSRGRTADTRTPATVLGRRLAAIKRFGAAHIKVATWARIFDGGRDGGPAWEYLIRGANDAGDFETTRRAQATEALTKILSPVMKELQRKAQYPSIGRSLTREQVLVMALNTGNEGNWQRMLDGEGWTRPQVMGVLNTLTAAEWQAVQGVWDHMESYRPEIGAKEKRVYGKEPEWVQSVPLLVDTSDGQRLTLRGGYFPIKYDPAANARAEGHADAEDAKRQMQGAYTSATTRRGFTKSRVQEVKGRPLMYSLGAVYGGVQDVIHDLAWHEWLIDTNKLLRSEKVDAAIRQHYGPEVVKQVKDWVKDIAAGDGPAQGAVDEAVSRLRRGVSVAGLGFNVMSAAMQPLGLTQSMVRVGAAWIGRGVAQYIANPRAAARRVNAASEFMASRARTRFRELNELRNQVEGQAGALTWVQQHSFWLMMRAQQTADIPTWLGAYEKAISEGSDEARSVALADQAVIDSQGGGQLKDLAGIERGGPAQKLFTVFYSFFNTALNIGIGQGMTADTPAKRAKLAADALLLYSVPAVLGAILKDALQPGGDDDPEELAKKLAAAQLDYLMGLFVLVRETTEAVKIVTGLEDRPRDYAGPAGLRVIPDAFKFAKQAGQGEFDDAFRKAFVNLIGSAFGLPAAQVNRTITGAQALAEDETDNPAALVFGFQKER